MAIVIALLVIVVGSVIFHLVTPWWTTPLASNWSQMDATLAITLATTGAFFVIINLFVAYTVWRYRHRKNAPARATYEPENRKLEHWLIGITTVGIIVLLAPGLAVYATYVHAPDDALLLEVTGQQWQWHYRFASADDMKAARLGHTDARFVSATNPLGLDPLDADAQGNIIVLGNEVHLPKGRPVKVLLRSNDVLHDFFVPQFRARMNIVPGQMSTFWFTPMQAGRYEAMCAQLCGVGHPNMRGYVVVEDETAFHEWLAQQPTFATTQSTTLVSPADAGRALAQSKGCVACHSVDGTAGVGPTWKGLFGKTETMVDGSTVVVDEAYVKAFVRNPMARAVKGYAQVMPKIELTDDELAALVTYIASNGSNTAATSRGTP